MLKTYDIPGVGHIYAVVPNAAKQTAMSKWKPVTRAKLPEELSYFERWGRPQRSRGEGPDAEDDLSPDILKKVCQHILT